MKIKQDYLQQNMHRFQLNDLLKIKNTMKF
jgi:hypothetical protein